MKNIKKNNQHAIDFLQKHSFVEIKYMAEGYDLIPMELYSDFITRGQYV